MEMNLNDNLDAQVVKPSDSEIFNWKFDAIEVLRIFDLKNASFEDTIHTLELAIATVVASAEASGTIAQSEVDTTLWALSINAESWYESLKRK